MYGCTPVVIHQNVYTILHQMYGNRKHINVRMLHVQN